MKWNVDTTVEFLHMAKPLWKKYKSLMDDLENFKKELEENLSLIFSTLMMGEDDVLIPFSAQTGLNTDIAWDVINRLCGLEES